LILLFFRKFESANGASVLGAQPRLQAIGVENVATGHEHTLGIDRNVFYANRAGRWLVVVLRIGGLIAKCLTYTACGHLTALAMF